MFFSDVKDNTTWSCNIIRWFYNTRTDINSLSIILHISVPHRTNDNELTRNNCINIPTHE